MRVVFIGSSKFGLRCLETCLDLSEIDVVGVVTAPQKFSISYRPSGVINVLHADVYAVARSRNMPIQSLTQSMSDTDLFASVSKWNPDAFLVVGWYHMIPKRWRELVSALWPACIFAARL